MQSTLAVVSEIEMSDIEATDFTMVKAKLQDAEEGPGWTSDSCAVVEREYKRFLALKRAYPGKEIVPDKLVDIFWHQHILDTEKYSLDCTRLFGCFLHHFPYFGMQGPDDLANLHAAFAETQILRELHFGSELEPIEADKAKCRTQCKPMKCR